MFEYLSSHIKLNNIFILSLSFDFNVSNYVFTCFVMSLLFQFSPVHQITFSFVWLLSLNQIGWIHQSRLKCYLQITLFLEIFCSFVLFLFVNPPVDSFFSLTYFSVHQSASSSTYDLLWCQQMPASSLGISLLWGLLVVSQTISEYKDALKVSQDHLSNQKETSWRLDILQM